MKRWLLTLAKLLVVAALMAIVFGNVHWEDRLVYRQGAGGPVVKEVPGAIEGQWDLDPVAFRPDGGATASYPVGEQPDGTLLAAEPGFWTYWKNLDGLLFALGALCYLATVLIAGTRWWWLLRVNGLGVGLGEALRLTWIGTFFNTVVPGQTGGDLIKAIYIMKRCPGQRVPALVSVIVDRVLGLASLAVLGAVVVLFALDRFGTIALSIWGVMAAVGACFVIAFSKRLRRLVRLKELLEKLPARFGGLLKLVDQAVFFYRDHKRVIVASLLFGIFNHVVSVMSVLLIGNALGVGMPSLEYFVLIPVINIVSAVPLAPNGWGLGEWMYQGLFSTYAPPGVPPAVMGTRGFALSVLYRLHLTLWSLLGGVFVLFEKDRVTRADVAHEVELEEQEAAGAAGPE